ncbi:hypothetical protein AMS68_004283 [Peltaster fructicola]|uniref:DUF1772 domain-containing protein n=1 Tax=Peltaster fructicola TaxID=286661 RepID=A0A6H0XVQ7_9PEZI|nr:hypothetical protein AMS68_004283 [Peltaster fructicola]
MTLLATVRGLAIAVSFITTGSLATSSFVTIPSILSITANDPTTAQTLARHFEASYRYTKIAEVSAEIFATLAFGYLAFQTRSLNVSSWKFYAGASAAMFAVFPWTLLTMDTDAQKIMSLTGSRSSQDTEPKLEHGALAVPSSPRPCITPIEEFEPYEDSPFSGAEYEELKVKKLLENWRIRNVFRIITTALAGALALGAVTTRVTLVTIVQGR